MARTSDASTPSRRTITKASSMRADLGAGAPAGAGAFHRSLTELRLILNTGRPARFARLRRGRVACAAVPDTPIPRSGGGNARPAHPLAARRPGAVADDEDRARDLRQRHDVAAHRHARARPDQRAAAAHRQPVHRVLPGAHPGPAHPAHQRGVLRARGRHRPGLRGAGLLAGVLGRARVLDPDVPAQPVRPPGREEGQGQGLTDAAGVTAGPVADRIAAPGADTLRVMTYNILYDTSPTGGGSGEERWPLVLDGIRGAGPDLAALQEVLPGRIAAIPRDLPEYAMAVSEPGGSGRAIAPLLAISAVALVLLILRRRRRRDPAERGGRLRRIARLAVTVVLWALVLGIPGALAFGSWYVGGYGNLNERLAFLYRPERLRLVESSTVWFSPTPTKPGTRGPFEFEPRIAQLGVFVRVPQGDTLAVLNVHPGHSPAAFAPSARLMRSLLDPR